MSGAIDPGVVAEFRDTFLRGGWRLAERNYGHASAKLMQLMALAGGPALLAERRALQPCGRKAGGAVIPARDVAQEPVV